MAATPPTASMRISRRSQQPPLQRQRSSFAMRCTSFLLVIGVATVAIGFACPSVAGTLSDDAGSKRVAAAQLLAAANSYYGVDRIGLPNSRIAEIAEKALYNENPNS